MCVIKLLLVQ